METQQIKVLAKKLNLTDPENEPYILSKEEEDKIIYHAINQAKTHMYFRLLDLGDKPEKIEEKIKKVNWDDEINRQEILNRHNSCKHQDLWHEEQRKKEKKAELDRYSELANRCNAKYMFMLMKWASKNYYSIDFLVTQENKHLITTICYFLSNDERFEKELGYSFRKGLLIRGVSGIGKTHVIQCVKENELNPILILSMIEVTEKIKQYGEYEILLGSNKVIYLDDVGTEEPTVNHYGTKISFFKNFIELVYLKNQNKTFNKLIISTNNSFSELEDKYGFRVRSRIKDMFNIIDVTGSDMRGSLK